MIKNTLKLFNNSIALAFKTRIKVVILFLLGITGIKKRKKVFSQIELLLSSNRISFLKTIWFNYRCLPLNQAKKLPIHIYKGTQIISSAGKISIRQKDVTFGMIRWGWFHTYRSQGKTRIQLNGNLIFNGGGKIFLGSEIVVWEGATLELGDSFFVGENVLIYCQHRITIDKSVCISYQCDICDSDFHYSVDTNTGSINPKFAAIHLGAYNWIGNKTTIKKGTKTPHHLMVASAYSVLSKDYTKTVEPYSVIGGIPAKILKTNISRIWHDELRNIAVIDNELKNKESFSVNKADINKLINL